ncbi:phosphopantetheine-binding protein [Maliponia aquimaris]|uniref:Putative acetyltransferase EpsM n=1 Tax=Maliponia aquimaris TaxID=1673631 RepID=A0A238KUB5_9RHOB|nr:phosphopantetheine-binding protein [Maliponia aquimaris]SMX46230.1 Putative acetyltransferase EpsM [Maliponia aquimaris]
MTTLYLCAAGNPEAVRLALTVNEASPRWDRIVLLDDDPAKQGVEIMGVPVVGPFAALAGHQPGDEAVNLVARSTKGRDRAREKIEGFGIALASLVHPAVDLRGTTQGRAVTIYGGSVVSALSTVGDHAVIFTQAVLGHGATLGAGAVLAPGAVVNARVRVGARAYIGSNASVLPDLEIGEDATVSACSAAVFDVPPGATALGVPAENLGGPMSAASVPQAPPQAPAPVPEADRSALLAEVRAIYAQVLGVSSIGSEVNFFHAGGDSRRALELQLMLGERLGRPVRIVDIFQFPTPALLAAHVLGGQGTPARPSRATLRQRRLHARS